MALVHAQRSVSCLNDHQIIRLYIRAVEHGLALAVRLFRKLEAGPGHEAAFEEEKQEFVDVHQPHPGKSGWG